LEDIVPFYHFSQEAEWPLIQSEIFFARIGEEMVVMGFTLHDEKFIESIQ
jgi:hypothetical protein